MPNNEIILCLTTLNSLPLAEKLATKIIKSKLAACVSISQIQSIYNWEGKIKKEDEFQLLIKTTMISKDLLLNLITLNHPYQLPEIIFVPIIDSNIEYSDWIKNFVQ